ncbi:proteinase [Dactylonectria estremocensis]|uniref:Proteinase n=1 Tax=Dactylonectria estremocensis TaxID=1079267 RepID=A0A9P9EUI4_9HYPO|nr:proteinase [Dactylonectria estremocensis]
MEKRRPSGSHIPPSLLTPASSPLPGRVTARAPFRISLACILFWIIASLSYPNATTTSPPWGFQEQPGAQPHDAFRWEDVTPHTSLRYVTCYEAFQCARLSVPLNWNSSAAAQETGPRAAIAIIKLPAKVPVTDPRYGGLVLVNPGGPGESGVYQVLTDGKGLQNILDDPVSPDGEGPGTAGGKYFDILSFDPRGVNNTTPQLRCFSGAFDQQAWLLSLPDYGLLWHSESITGMEWARATALGASCSYGESETGILQHLNTAQTVQDMLQIVEKHGEWRANEARHLFSNSCSINLKPTSEVIHRTGYQPGQEMIQYWGMSYGTLIGSTFAAMHPNRIGRMVIDGVVDPADHYAGTWLTQLQDSDKIISKFCEYCFQAGPDKCHLYTGSSGADVEARLTTILLHLKISPIAMPPSRPDDGPAFITYGDAHLALLSAMYFPFAVAEDFFDLLVAIEGRNTSSPTLLRVVATKQGTLNKAGCEPKGSHPEERAPYVSGFGSFQAISCMDSGGASNLTRESFNEYLAVIEAQGRWISPSWARNKLSCLGHTLKPVWNLGLSFGQQEWANTSHPLLIVSNTHDTVTPLRNARRVSTLFPGSVVLQQDSQGHCSHSNPSLCTAKTIRAYFQTGDMPAEGTVCEPAIRPFLGCTAGNDGDRGECKFTNHEEARLWETMVELADPFGLRPKTT